LIVYPESVNDNLSMALWCCERLGESIDSFGFDHKGTPMFQTIGFSREGKLLCVVIAYHYAPPNVMWAFAADNPRWASKENIAAAGQWVFGQLGCTRVTSIVKKSNKRSRKFQEGIGFKVEGKLKKAHPEGDLLIYGLLKDEHDKWLRKAFNEQGRK